jgi:hypothetical protein
MSGLDKNSISDLEVQCQSSSSIGKTFMAFLCFDYMESEFLMKFIMVNHKVPSLCGGEIALRGC